MAAKILVAGHINGQLREFFTKLAALHAKNSFSFAIVTGNLFDADDEVVTELLDERLEVPLSTYFTASTNPLPERIIEKVKDGEDLCPNLHFLGKRSTTKTIDGIRLVTLGGVLDKNIIGGVSNEQHLPFHTEDDARSLKGANTADILITSLWPRDVWKGSNQALPVDTVSPVSESIIAELCAALKPRYHLSPSPGNFFYQREPFVQRTDKPDDANSITRFVSMAPLNNPDKAKAIYAFQLTPPDPAVAPMPVGCTTSPFPNLRKRPAIEGDRSYPSRFSNEGRDNNRFGRGGKRQKLAPIVPDNCIFCLGNQNVSDHMVCSVGEETYLSTARGPLTLPLQYSDVGLAFPCNMLIVPLPHTPTLSALREVDGPEAAKRTTDEMHRFRRALQAMVATRSKHKLGAVTFEISRGSLSHLCWQFLPVDADLVDKGLVEAAFKIEAENMGYKSELREVDEDADPPVAAEPIPGESGDASQGPSGDYLRVWIYRDDREDTVATKTLAMPLAAGQRFDVQFPRRAMAKLMKLDDRANWKNCRQGEGEETADAAAFRAAFEEWDFTVQKS